MKRKTSPKLHGLPSVGLALLMTTGMAASAAMTPMADQELSSTTGQDSLLAMNVINPGELGNPNDNVGFYKMTLNAKLDMNANARRVQLGCGGVNGADGCDIDINYLRFAGLGAVDPTTGRPINDKGPSTDFEQINPFFEMAIANPNSPTGRKIVGMRFGAEQARGIISNGTRPVDANNNPISINRTPVTYNTGLGTVTNEVYDPNEHTGVNQISAVIDQMIITNGTVPIKINLGVTIDATGKIMEGGPCNNNPSVCEPYMLGQRLDANGNLIKNTRSNVFEKVYFARAKTMRLAPLSLEVSSDNQLADNKQALADLKSDARLVHNMQVGTPTTYANDFYFSFSTLGNNDVWATLGSDHGPERAEATTDAQRMMDYANVVNSPNPSAVGSWLNWRSASGSWTPMMRGWALHLPKLLISNFTTPTQNANALAALFTPDRSNLNDNLDIQQVPVDNCYGTLKFC